MAAYVEQNFLGTSKAYDLGRGQRSDPVHGIPQFTKGPGQYDIKREFDKDESKGFDFGYGAAHGGVDDRLTRNEQDTLDRMYVRREGVIGECCEKEAKRQNEKYPGPGFEPIKSSIRPYPFPKTKTAPPKAPKITQDGPGPDMYTIK